MKDGSASSRKGNAEEIAEKVLRKELSMRQIEDYLGPAAAAEARKLVIEKATGAKLSAIGSSSLDYSQISNKNAENVIGYSQMPMGIAGPMKVNGMHARGEFYVPMATTEGALIASVSRGMKAISMSGGASARVLKDSMTRAPVFELGSIVDTAEFLEWIERNQKGIRAAAEATTSHGKVKEILPFVLGNNVWIRFAFSTGDAMGMNMVTIASEAACEYMEKGFGKARLVSVSGNMCSDKKESAVNSLLGRGKTVVADALIKGEVVSELLKATPEGINNLNIKKNLLGSARAGSSKFNGHAANMVAAVFAATGQDIAQVVESSSCFTLTEVRGKDLYISVTMPSIEVGTIGGGSSLPTQREALSIMGVAGGGDPPGSNSLKFAEIIAAAVLAGELNLLAAQFSRDLGKAHRKLGRNAKA
ncbi:MAG TPA: hydroxymethylglutaryl-CoA reductase (NADPH) [Candidatus Saccharimonadales bacterium]|nr:hydroxymethylglutaryl-CoA reductase (NADPH) [Candidatus Saccharimonadales bacterium]